MSLNIIQIKSLITTLNVMDVAITPEDSIALFSSHKFPVDTSCTWHVYITPYEEHYC